MIPRGIGRFTIICAEMYRQENTQKIKYGRTDGELFDHTEVVFLNCSYCELKNWGKVAEGRMRRFWQSTKNDEIHTISVASTRVPMIFMRIFVLFSMTYRRGW